MPSIRYTPIDNWTTRKTLQIYKRGIIILGIIHVVVSFGVVMQYFVNQYTGDGVLSLLGLNITGSVYYISVLIFSVLGCFYHGYFYLFHLLYIVQNNSDLANAVNAVTHNGKSLVRSNKLHKRAAAKNG